MVKLIKSLASHKGFVKYFNNTLLIFFEKVLRIFVGLFVSVWVARYLGPTDFGEFSYILSFVGIFSVLATLGLDSIVVRELVAENIDEGKIIGTAFLLKIIGFFLVIAAILFAIPFTSNNSYTNILIFIVAGATIFQSFNVVDMYFQSKVLSKYVVYANFISLFISSIVKIIFILNEYSLIYFIWVIVFDSLILAAGLVYFFTTKSTISIKNLKFDKETSFFLLKDSWPLIFSGIVISIYMRIDQIMIREILNIESVGQYAAAHKISSAWYFVPSVIVSSLFPAIIKAKKDNHELYLYRLQFLYDFMIWIGVFVAIVITLNADAIISLLYGSQYNQSSQVLAIHIWTVVVMNFGIVWSKWLILENMQRYGLYGDIFSLLVNIVLNLFLIRLYGINGAAIATFISYLITPFLVMAFIRNNLPIVMLLNSLNIIKVYKNIKEYKGI